MGFLSLGTSLRLDVGSTSLVAQHNAVNRVLSGTRATGAVLSWLEVNLGAGRGLDLRSLSQGRVQGQGLGYQMGSILALSVRRPTLRDWCVVRFQWTVHVRSLKLGLEHGYDAV